MSSSSFSVQGGVADAPPRDGAGGASDASKTGVSRLEAAAPTSHEPPRTSRPPRGAPVAAAAAAAAAHENASQTHPLCHLSLASLPHALLLQIFAALPVDARLRCAEVCRAFRNALLERSLWTQLDLSETSGVTYAVTPALLRASAAKARRALTALDVTGVWEPLRADGALREVLAANAGTLRELRCLRGRDQDWMRVPVVEALLSAAPQLRVCEADALLGDVDEASRVLRKEGVFASLRLHTARLNLLGADAATLVPLFADMAAHASLADLQLYGAYFDVPAVLDAFVDAALSLPLLRSVSLFFCHLSPASAPALARLLSSGTLTKLTILNDGRVLLDAPSAMHLADALRANATLTSLTLHQMQLWSDRAVAAALLGALTGHASLRELRITAENVHVLDRFLDDDDQRHIGAALLGSLIAANAPALTTLDVHYCRLGDAGLRPLFAALPGNSHLRTLDCSMNNISAAFAADVLLSAVRANTSLRTLITHAEEQPPNAAREAEALVAGRS
jgi:hypothetical protein